MQYICELDMHQQYWISWLKCVITLSRCSENHTLKVGKSSPHQQCRYIPLEIVTRLFNLILQPHQCIWFHIYCSLEHFHIFYFTSAFQTNRRSQRGFCVSVIVWNEWKTRQSDDHAQTHIFRISSQGAAYCVSNKSTCLYDKVQPIPLSPSHHRLDPI